MNKLFCTTFAVALLCALAADAGDHLVPEQSVLGGYGFDTEYQARVRGVFHEAFDNRSVVFRMIKEPSFLPELVVGLGHDDTGYKIFMLKPSVFLWSYSSLESLQSGAVRCVHDGTDCNKRDIDELKATLPADWHDVEVRRCEVNLDEKTAKHLMDVWKKMLLGTRYDENPVIGLDGTTYHFEGWDMEGQIWSPDGDTNPGRLVNIAEAMSAICDAGSGASSKALSEKIDDLANHLGIERQ
jgi:hypothetical protein